MTSVAGTWSGPNQFEQPVDAEVYEKTVAYFEEMMQLLHPFMPFISEEIYQLLKEQVNRSLYQTTVSCWQHQ